MAFLVVYKEKSEEIDWKNKAIYLEQDFYQAIYECHKEYANNSVLREMSLLAYGDEMELDSEKLKNLKFELDKSNVNHPQILELKSLISRVLEKNTKLVLSGDMHPELK